MNVEDLMTRAPRTCTPDTTLAAAAKLMWDGDCGILPVTENGRLVGVVTDRDMYIALATQNARPSDVTIGTVAARNVVTCGPRDDVQAALAAMKQFRVRRLPVVGPEGTLVGMLSMNDLLLSAGSADRAVSSDDVVRALQAIGAHHHEVQQVGAA